ncbi:hypothetical protein FOZ63_014338 [Perkinsus olseni]|uniref:F-box domain-containing protein n=1 Tax=Perkinsus olseni TaxID=32597 RepID=A0A7J6T929_PEROL|nr:hypothetical protein FOZ63_014338 [Perkinsus olseni]
MSSSSSSSLSGGTVFQRARSGVDRIEAQLQPGGPRAGSGIKEDERAVVDALIEEVRRKAAPDGMYGTQMREKALALISRWEAVKRRFAPTHDVLDATRPESLQAAFVGELQRLGQDAVVEWYGSDVVVRIGDCRFTVMTLGRSVIVEGMRQGRRIQFRRTCAEPLIYGLPVPHFCELPVDLANRIVGYCISVRDLAHLELTCKFLNASCAPFWHNIATQLGLKGNLPPKTLVRNHYAELRAIRRRFVIPRVTGRYGGPRHDPIGGFPYHPITGIWNDKDPGGGLIPGRFM